MTFLDNTMLKLKFFDIKKKIPVFILSGWMLYDCAGATSAMESSQPTDCEIVQAIKLNKKSMLLELLGNDLTSPQIGVNQSNIPISQSPIYWAAMYGSNKSYKALIRQGANLDVKTGLFEDVANLLGSAVFNTPNASTPSTFFHSSLLGKTKKRDNHLKIIKNICKKIKRREVNYEISTTKKVRYFTEIMEYAIKQSDSEVVKMLARSRGIAITDDLCVIAGFFNLDISDYLKKYYKFGKVKPGLVTHNIDGAQGNLQQDGEVMINNNSNLFA